MEWSAIAMRPFYFCSHPNWRIAKNVEFAKKHHKAWIHLAAGDKGVAQRLKDWLAQNPVDVLNVAGPWASNELGIYKLTSLA
jgi:hypothetical protein